MPATLKLTHKAIGAEVRRGTYDVVVDGERAGSVEMNHTIEIPVETLGARPPGMNTGARRSRFGREDHSRNTSGAMTARMRLRACRPGRSTRIRAARFVRVSAQKAVSRPAVQFQKTHPRTALAQCVH